MRANARREVITTDGSTDLNKVAEELTTPSLKEISKELVSVIGLVKTGRVGYEEARLRMTGCKHLIQLIAIERLARR